jgi:serine protease Do
MTDRSLAASTVHRSLAAPGSRHWHRLSAALLCGVMGCATWAQSPIDLVAGAAERDARAQALARARAAIVGVQSTTVEDARSNESLGRERSGSGVVVGRDGLVLTIGYLVLEADSVDLVLDDDRKVPARVVAYDLASGFGLLQALTPFTLGPVPLGRSANVTASEPLLIVSGADGAALTLARLVSRRAYSGYWEYHIDDALFTAPPHRDHSGAGLFNADGELLGIGSLAVGAAAGPTRGRVAGNMFVPIDLLKPILSELREHGTAHSSTRAWIGVNCVEQDGVVRVVRVNRDSPAEYAGLQPGDRIVRIDGTDVHSLESLYRTLWRDGAEREVTLDIRRDEVSQTLRLRSQDRMKTLRQPQGI